MQPISVGTCAIGGEELASRAPSAEIQTLSACIPRSGSQRGFNQAEFIARAATRRLALPGRELTTNRLARQRATASQIGLTRPQRAEEIRGAFRVAYPGNIAGRGIWLIDRVLPTGTTASEWVAACEKRVATLARTLKDAGMNSAAEPDFEIVELAS